MTNSQYPDDQIKAYIEQLLKVQQQDKPVDELMLRKIALDMGISAEDMAMLQKEFNDSLLRGQGYSRYEDWESAVEELERAVMLNPVHVEAMYSLANAYKHRWLLKKSKDDLNKAKSLCKRVLQINPAHEPSLRISSELNRGVANYNPKKMADSFTTFKQHLPTQTTTYIPDKRLKRSVFNKKIAGVCGGIAEYFGIDSTLVRIAFVLGTFVFGGVFIPLYVVLALVLPKR